MAFDNIPEKLPLGVSRLLALADVLERVPDQNYDQGAFSSSCGTIHCALGWAVAAIPEVVGLRFATQEEASHINAFYMPNNAMVRLDGTNAIETGMSRSVGNNLSLAAEVFEITSGDALAMFGSSGRFYEEREPTPQTIARKLREFAMAKVKVGG